MGPLSGRSLRAVPRADPGCAVSETVEEESEAGLAGLQAGRSCFSGGPPAPDPDAGLRNHKCCHMPQHSDPAGGTAALTPGDQGSPAPGPEEFPSAESFSLPPEQCVPKTKTPTTVLPLQDRGCGGSPVSCLVCSLRIRAGPLSPEWTHWGIGPGSRRGHLVQQSSGKQAGASEIRHQSPCGCGHGHKR